MSVEWKNPPGTSRTGRPAKFSAEAAELRENPGQWGRLCTIAKAESGILRQKAAGIKSGRMAAFRPAGSFEAVARRQEDGTYGLFARYVGDTDLVEQFADPALIGRA